MKRKRGRPRGKTRIRTNIMLGIKWKNEIKNLESKKLIKSRSDFINSILRDYFFAFKKRRKV